MSLFAISNIHGNNFGFQKILKKAKFTKQDTLVILGDVVDFGNDSKSVFDTIFLLKEHGFKVICIRGDHEQMVLDALNDNLLLEKWLRNGGKETLGSFNCSEISLIPQKYIDFIKSFQNFYLTENCYFVHGGIDMTQDNPLRHTQSLLSLSNWQEKYIEGWLNGSLVIHGHTPQNQKEITNQFNLGFDVIGIDNGNQVEKIEGFGQLCILNVDEKLFIFED